MKKLLLLLLPSFLLSDDLMAQDWIQTNGPFAAHISSIAYNSRKDLFVIANGRLLRSLDHGTSWKRLGSELGISNISTMAISSNNDIYISNIQTSKLFLPGVLKSTDNGDSWVQIFSLYASALSVHDSTIFIGVDGALGFYFLRSKNQGKTWDSSFFSLTNSIFNFGIDSNGIMIDGDNGCMRSSDEGQSWNSVTNGIQNLVTYSCACGRKGNIYFSPQQLSAYSLHSSDDGITWSRLPFGLGQFAVSPSGRVLYSGVGVVKYSDDDGVTWTDYGGANQLADTNGFYSPVFAADSGFYASVNNNLLYAKSPGVNPWKYTSIPLSSVIGLASTSNGELIASILPPESSSLRSTDEGNSWTPLFEYSGLSAPYWFIIDSSQDVLGGDLTIIRLIDTEKIWRDIYDPIASATAGTVLPDGTIIIATYAGEFYRSTDRGTTWGVFQGPPEILSLASNSAGNIFAGGTQAVYRSLDQGKTWSIFNVDNSLGASVEYLTIDSYGGLYSYLYGYGLYRSFDNGETWSSFVTGLPGKQSPGIYSIVAASDGTVFIGTDSGVFRHNVRDCSWSPFSDGLTTKRIYSLAINKEGRLFAGSDSGGVFKSSEIFNKTVPLMGRINTEDVDFGSVAIGDTVCRDVFIKNVGLAPFTLTGSFLFDPVPFSRNWYSSTQLPLILKPKDSVLVNICFHPYQPGAYASEIDWNTDIKDSICIPVKPQSFLKGVAYLKDAVSAPYPEKPFSIRPNPTSVSTITIVFPEVQKQTVSLSIYDVLGREVYKTKISPGQKELSVPIMNFYEGTYYVQIITGDVVATERFIKIQ